MSKETRRVPKLRFPGFTEDWEQRKFDEIYERSGRKNDLTYGIDKIISVANMYFKTDAIVGSEKYLKTYNVFKLGDIAFEGHTNKEYSYGRFVENTIGDGIISHIFDVFTPKINLDINFWKDLIKYEPIMGPILRRCTKASRMMSNLTSKAFLEEKILCPTLEEQKLIGGFIVRLDKNITLHQRKLDHLNMKKKALLQKLFPKNGERYPELRFSGFTDAWEQRKFVDLFEYERPDAYIVKSDNYNDKFNMPVLTANKAFILGYTNEKNSYDKPSIIFDDFTLDRKYVDFPYMLKSSAIKILTSKSQHNLRFLFERLNATRFEVLGHARHYISVVQNTTTLCPSIEEAVCISNLLTKFDELLTLHQRKLEHLQLQKKALLQQMFV